MDTFSLIGFAVVTAILSCTVRQFNNAAGMNVALAGGAFILLSIIAKVSRSCSGTELGCRIRRP